MESKEILRVIYFCGQTLKDDPRVEIELLRCYDFDRNLFHTDACNRVSGGYRNVTGFLGIN